MKKSSVSKRAKGRPRIPTPGTGSVSYWLKKRNGRDGQMVAFVEAHIKADPKPYGAKERAYRAALERFGRADRSSVLRVLATARKHSEAVKHILPEIAAALAPFHGLDARFAAAFSESELCELGNVSLHTATKILEAIEENQRNRIAGNREKPVANKSPKSRKKA